MTDRITPGQFQDAVGVEHWRALLDGHGAYAQFRTGSFATGVALVDAIGLLADEADHHPDIQLRYGSVTVRLRTHDVDGFSERDVALARQISEVARELDVSADPTAIQHVDLTIDAMVGTDVMPFWRALLGYQQKGAADLADALDAGPAIWFQEMDEPRPQRNRIHVDVTVPHDQAEARVAAAVAAGGRLVTDQHAPSWWVLADAEGNEACVSTWMGRD
jgi:4a-hydroxytetrahydrobiopterin dehydratase